MNRYTFTYTYNEGETHTHAWVDRYAHKGGDTYMGRDTHSRTHLKSGKSMDLYSHRETDRNGYLFRWIDRQISGWMN